MLILAIVALILSVGVTYFAYRLLKSRLQPIEANAQILVATEQLPMGTRLTEKHVKLAAWPKATPLTGSITDPAQAVGRALLDDVLPNEPILESRLASKDSGAGLIVAIPEGMRAQSIQVNSIIGVTGFVLPGSRVDLILTSQPPSSVTSTIQGAPKEEMVSKIILENLQVLATGQNIQRDIDGKPQSVQEVTLLVTPEQAEKIALATGEGRIQLVLRNQLDNTIVDPPLIFKSALYEGSGGGSSAKMYPGKPIATEKGPKPVASAARTIKKKPVAVASAKAITIPPPPPPEPASKILTIELIQGSKRVTGTFEDKKP
jgi:pilus assembly protein CpaB